MNKRQEFYVLAIDPGGDIGWSYGQGEEVIEWGIDDDASDFLYNFERMSHVWGPVQRIVVERFDLRQFTNDAMDTLKLIGAIEWIAARDILHLSWVNPSDKKKTIRTIPPEIKSHARDAEAIRLWDYLYGDW